MPNDALVLVEPEHERSAPGLWHSEDRRVVGTDAEIAEALREFGGSNVVLHGSDALVSRALSNWYADRELRVRDVTWTAVPVDESASVANTLFDGRLGSFSKRWRKAASSGGLKSAPLQTMVVVDSGLPFRRVGFSVGFGTLRHASVRSLAGLAEQLVDDSTGPDRFRWVVDGSPQREVGFLLASTLPKVGGTVGMGKGCTYRSGSSVAALFPQATKVGRIVARATGAGRAEAFDRIHIDGASGYLLDGVALTVEGAGVIELRSGPRPQFSRVS